MCLNSATLLSNFYYNSSKQFIRLHLNPKLQILFLWG